MIKKENGTSDVKKVLCTTCVVNYENHLRKMEKEAEEKQKQSDLIKIKKLAANLLEAKVMNESTHTQINKLSIKTN
jgi:hypothetical protein